MQKCRKCLENFKPAAHQVKKSDWICKECRGRYDAEWRDRRRKAGLKASGSKTWDAEKREAWNEQRKADPKVMKRKADHQKKYRNNPALRMRHEARWQVNHAIESGKMKRLPCIKCGEPKTHGHHPDYSKPLEVIWLCRPHHQEEHAKAEGRE